MTTNINNNYNNINKIAVKLFLYLRVLSDLHILWNFTITIIIIINNTNPTVLIKKNKAKSSYSCYSKIYNLYVVKLGLEPNQMIL